MRNFPDIPYGKDRMQLLDLWLPDSGEFDLYIHLHGGGLQSGSRRVDIRFPQYLTDRGIGLASVEYRMYKSDKHPENNAKYPDFIEDAAAAAAWVKAHIAEYGKAKRVFLGGSSAGGYLSMMLCFDKRWLAAHGLAPMDFAGFFHDAGQPTKHFNVLKFSGEDSRRIVVDEAAPIYYVGLDAEYPPMRFVVSDNDMKNRYEQTVLMLSTLRHFGYDESKFDMELHSGTHTQYCSTYDENGESVYGQMICKFINDVK